MLTRRGFLLSGAAFSLLKAAPLTAQTAATPQLQFNGTRYFFRWTNDRLFEFTPQGQEDLEKWIDMISVVVYREVDTPEKLLGKAKAVLDTYKANRGGIIGSGTYPATAQTSAQHFITAMILGNGVVEAVFTRLLLSTPANYVSTDGMGYGFIYSHRRYAVDGNIKDAIHQLGEWEKTNGKEIASALIRYAPVPDVETLERWKQAKQPASH